MGNITLLKYINFCKKWLEHEKLLNIFFRIQNGRCNMPHKWSLILHQCHIFPVQVSPQQTIFSSCLVFIHLGFHCPYLQSCPTLDQSMWSALCLHFAKKGIMWFSTHKCTNPLETHYDSVVFVFELHQGFHLVTYPVNPPTSSTSHCLGNNNCWASIPKWLKTK
jgi:hypothetical protein